MLDNEYADLGKHLGWGVVGKPKEGLLVDGPEGPSLDVTGYSEPDYWELMGDGRILFLGPDEHGIVPIYELPDGSHFPEEATQYPHLA